MTAESAEATIARRLRFQAEACAMLGSALYAELLSRAAADVEAHGPAWDVLRGHERDPGTSVLALRLMGAVNRLVLAGEEPALAGAYSNGGEPAAAWPAFREVLDRRGEQLRPLLELPVQTNEPGRCAALLPGFLTVAAETGLPLRLLEVGASAGLNLRWDSYRYAAGGLAWGPGDSPARIEFELSGGAFPDPAPVEVAERLGCDTAPIDPISPEGRLALLAYVWPDQATRLERMRAALEVAAERPVTVEREGAAAWIERKLAEPSSGTATVVFHSIVMQYLSEEERAAFHDRMRDAGRRASAAAPLAWLWMEPAGRRADLRLTLWPGGEERHLARAAYHGSSVELLA